MLVGGNLAETGCEVLAGKLIYETDAIAVVELNAIGALPTEFAITSAYPNPFNSVMLIGYSLPEAAEVRLSVYDVTGRLVSELVRGKVSAGNHLAV